VSAVLRQSLLLLALAVLPAAGDALYYRDKLSWHSRLASSEMVTVAEARAWGGNAIWVDARPDADFESEHVPGAILLNEDRWNELLPQFLQQSWSPEKKVVVYCSSESCNLAGDVARRLREEAKLPNEVRVLEGGWEEWLRTRK
jgi:rhodanese-related sulfurtransferase